MASIKFLLQSKSNPANIYVRLLDGRKIDIKTKTNFIINPNDWSDSKQRPKSLKSESFKNLDFELQELRTNLLNYYNASQDEIINLAWLKNFINPSDKTQIPKGLIAYFDFYLAQRNLELSNETKKKIKVVKHKLAKMEKKLRASYLIKEVNIKFKDTFYDYSKDEGYSDNTIFENLKEIKTICRHAQKNGIMLSPNFIDIKTPQKKAISIFLDFSELQKIEIAKIESDYLNNARDWLLISCYTAQRVSDFMRFTKDMIRMQENKTLIEFTQKKTGKIMTLPLHPKVLEILKKRNGDFPHAISSQKYNDYIKKVCEAAEIKEKVFGGKMVGNRKVMDMYAKHELVTSHIGRRSFATNFYGKIPTSLLISATGHSTEQMFLVYIGKSNSDKALQLSEWF